MAKLFRVYRCTVNYFVDLKMAGSRARPLIPEQETQIAHAVYPLYAASFPQLHTSDPFIICILGGQV